MSDSHPTPSTPLRVLVVENDPKWRRDHVNNLEAWGHKAFVAEPSENAPDAFQSLWEDAIAKAQYHRCHLALVDMRLRNDDEPSDNSGLELVPNLAPTVSIVVSGYGNMNIVNEASLGHLQVPARPHAFLPKSTDPKKLYEAIEKAVVTYWPCRSSNIKVILSQELTRQHKIARYLRDEEIQELIRQSFWEAQSLRLESAMSTTRPGGLSLRSRSIVLRVIPDDEEPVVVKIARSKRVAEERKNYEDFVARYFTGRFYGRYKRSVSMWNWGCAVYEFMGTIEPDIRLFTDYYSQESEHDICKVLDRFGKNLGKLYGRTRQRSDGSLFIAYSDAWDNEWCQKLDSFRVAFPAPATSSIWQLPDPVLWIQQRIHVLKPFERDATLALPYLDTAIIHGDLHGENMFVDSKGDIWLIDYERSRRGPILQDWAELENDILTRLIPLDSVDLSAFANLVIRLLSPSAIDGIVDGKNKLTSRSTDTAEIKKALTVLREVRKTAKTTTGVEDVRLYLWSLLFNVVYRLMYWQEHVDDTPENLARLQQCFLLGGLICHRLENFETRAGTWPPKQWSQADFRAEHKNSSRPIASKNLSTLLTHEPDQSVSQRPDFLVVTALAEERDALLKRLPGCQKLPPSETDIATCFQAHLPVDFPDDRVDEYRIILMPFLSMGRMKAATATANAITRWHPRYVVLVGIAGGIANQGVRIGDLLIASQIVDYELQKITPEGPQIRWEVHQADPRLLIASQHVSEDSWVDPISARRPTRGKPKPHVGPIASGDKVVAFASVLERYREVWPKLIGVEMEAAGVATAAFQSPEKPGFFMIRCVSDLADENKSSRRVEGWRAYACDAAASFAVAFLKSGPILPAGQFK